MSEHNTSSYYVQRYGKCLIDNCNHPRTKWGIYCINHDDEDDDLGRQVDLIYSYTIKCIICPWSSSTRGTRETERVTRIMGMKPCPKCGSILVIEDDMQIVGRLVKERSE